MPRKGLPRCGKCDHSSWRVTAKVGGERYRITCKHCGKSTITRSARVHALAREQNFKEPTDA